ncbi:hypothetical protein [Paraburkholderia sp. BL17N1]|uniref:hypothetical protein n=1 Tax=Paraburkholderia sp. BL17N1 TaxID=1938798 RepID=UPI0011C4075F|nr:hypothetical protein [Paraburkholderia sp. BL17N1]
MTRGVGITIVEQPQTIAASGNWHSKAKKKRDRRIIPATDAANRSGFGRTVMGDISAVDAACAGVGATRLRHFVDGSKYDDNIIFDY